MCLKKATIFNIRLFIKCALAIWAFAHLPLFDIIRFLFNQQSLIVVYFSSTVMEALKPIESLSDNQVLSNEDKTLTRPKQQQMLNNGFKLTLH